MTVAPEFMDVRYARILLHQYSEWLDLREKINPATPDTEDGRSHDDLVKLFIASRNPYAIPQLEERPPEPVEIPSPVMSPERDTTGLRLEALNYALRYGDSETSAEVVLARANSFFEFLRG